MKILVFGASGRVGSKLLEYGLAAGHEMFAFVRNPSKIPGQTPRLHRIQGDAEDPESIQAAIPGMDLILFALGTNQFKPPITLMSDALLFILEAMQTFQVPRIIAVAGAGILQEDAQTLKMNAAGFPAIFRPISEEYWRMFELLRDSDREWTLVCPPTMPERVRTGQYRVLAEYLPEGGQQIFVEDLADFILREIEARQFLRQRVGLAY